VRGTFITFEGPEGSGKSTQTRLLAERLRARGIDVLVTREPGGTRTGEAIRGIVQHDTAGEAIGIRAEILLFAASRAHLVQTVILPALSAGRWVLCDRFADSSTAYQGYGRGHDVEEILSINALAIDKAIPDVTILLDLDVRLGFERVTRRNASQTASHDRFEQEGPAFHERVAAGYRELAERWPQRMKRVDADREVEAVGVDVWQQVMPWLPGHGGGDVDG